ncbi:uncharacterized protein BX663DRAFT_546720 [Cokeromyces recurvatus]|uniref:uncharacterized protein n=1 Tax=Cokeromyces recurvatus TaxID=90255 RepID=UPI00221E4100|nr:uncharacterized protein BX663DRAFT_546720 [Cokeromyces recurvatus]KAI7897995.1 hypothetical protein BX663DRAFT_546720 [Cokeromyces recurvatus]
MTVPSNNTEDQSHGHSKNLIRSYRDVAEQGSSLKVPSRPIFPTTARIAVSLGNQQYVPVTANLRSKPSIIHRTSSYKHSVFYCIPKEQSFLITEFQKARNLRFPFGVCIGTHATEDSQGKIIEVVFANSDSVENACQTPISVGDHQFTANSMATVPKGTNSEQLITEGPTPIPSHSTNTSTSVSSMDFSTDENEVHDHTILEYTINNPENTSGSILQQLSQTPAQSDPQAQLAGQTQVEPHAQLVSQTHDLQQKNHSVNLSSSNTSTLRRSTRSTKEQFPLLPDSFQSNTIKIASINCRSLVKINNPTTRQDFVRFLRKVTNLDILTLQETNASSLELEKILTSLFRSQHTMWSKHCGIVCLNPLLQLQPIFISTDQRVLKCTVSHSQRIFDPLTIVTIYAPAQPSKRQLFFSRILDLPILVPKGISLNDTLISSITLPTRTIITGDFNYNAHDGSSKSLTGSQGMSNHQQRWHQHLQSIFRSCLDPANNLPTFRRGQQMSTIDYIFSSSDLYYQKFKLARVETQIQGLQEEMVANDALRAQKFWRETGESSPSYLKRSITTRLTKSFVPELTHPISSTSCTSPETLTEAARIFYQQLYTPDNIDLHATDRLAQAIDPSSTLKNLIHQYSLASNAKLNFEKTQAFSLSGKSNHYWTSFLNSLSSPITSWHDKHPPQALTYLGYPLYSSASQRNLAVDQLILKIQTGCQIHSERNLSVIGRTVVINTLLLSKFWHVLRVVPLTKSQIDRIRGICGAFLNASRFPRIAYRNLIPHKHHGGLGVLDPMVQQMKLHWRWLADLIISPTILQQPQYISATFLHTSIPYIKYDSLPPSNIDHADLSLATMLDLDLASIITSTSQTPFISQNESLRFTVFARNTLGMSKVRAKDFFIIDLETGLLRQRTDRETRYPRLLHKFRVAVGSNSVRLLYNFSRHMHFVLPAPDLPDAGLFPIVETQMPFFIRLFESPKHLGILIRDTLFPPQATTKLSPSQWNKFWRTSLPPAAHTVWFRTIHDKIPTKSLLNHLIPDTHPSPECTHCHHPEDNLRHFIYECPIKRHIWHTTITTFFPRVQITSQQLLSLLFSLDYGEFKDLTSPVASSVSFLSVVGCILLSLWKNHWRSVFDKHPFSSDILLPFCSAVIWQLHFQNKADI